jgi:DnaK suppressor protein
MELLRDSLEEQFQQHTDRLSQLTVLSRRADRGGYDDDMLAALIASARQAVADTAQALRRMADGSYGTCERCGATVPLERLEVVPHARFCAPCKRNRTGAASRPNPDLTNTSTAYAEPSGRPARNRSRNGADGRRSRRVPHDCEPVRET